MTIANVEMAEAWDGVEGDQWTNQADRYDAAAVGLESRLMESAAITADDRVLDVGCGTGKTSLSAARSASNGAVLGVDLSSRMLERARQRAETEKLSNVDFVRADAQVHPFPTEDFDIALSSFGVMFFADPVAAFTNIGRSLKPGGRLALLTWQAQADNAWIVAFRGALAMGRQLPTPPPDAPSPFSLAVPDTVRRILGAAGFGEIVLTAVDDSLRYGSDADDAFSFVRTMGFVRGLTQDLDEASSSTALEQLHQVLVEAEGPEGVALPAAAWIITATT